VGARAGEAAGAAERGLAPLDFNFFVEGDRVRIVPRKRGAPLDKLVSELMILANSRWGELLAERDIAAIYRVQSTGKVRLSVHPEPHEGLGVRCYAWMSSRCAAMWTWESVAAHRRAAKHAGRHTHEVPKRCSRRCAPSS